MTSTAFNALADNRYTQLPTSSWLKNAGKVEVIEFFSYGCGHCFELEPTIFPWIEQLPGDVHFRRVPAMFGGIWNTYGQLYLTLETLKVPESVHLAVFEAVRARTSLKTPDEMAGFLVAHGVEQETFLSTYSSFFVEAKIKEAQRNTDKFELTGVPALVINGRYRFDQSAGGALGMLRLADELIDKERISLEQRH
ncbi:thiol:disulfide interchange protein [Pseudomonas simiae]|nr:thiol:disulfide interchange protein [Pseudomonas simiae]